MPAVFTQALAVANLPTGIHQIPKAMMINEQK